MNELIKIEGTEGCFSDLIIPIEVKIDGIKRGLFKSHWNFLTFRYDRKIQRTKIYKEHMKEMNKLLFSLMNFRNASRGSDGVFRNELNKPEMGLYYMCYSFPRFFSIDRFSPKIMPGDDDVEVIVVKIKGSFLSYLKQKHGEDRNYKNMIRFYERVMEHQDNSVSFDEYIDSWAKRLLKGVEE